MPHLPWLRACSLPFVLLGLTSCGDPDAFTLRFGVDTATLFGTAPAGAGVRALESLPAPPAPPTFKSSDGLEFQLESATSTFFDVRLDLPRARTCADVQSLLSPLMTCEDPVEGRPGTLAIPGPLDVDWRRGTTRPAGTLRIPAGIYRQLDARLEPGAPGGVSFSVRANFVHLGQPCELELEFHTPEPIRFNTPGPLTAELPDGTFEVAMLELGTWLQDVPVRACLDKGDLTLTGNTLRLEDARGECAGAAERMKHNILSSGRLLVFMP
ncbi:hypothetical protein G4177_29070 [Corallococcus sp. ZKHCc1 1396]|uniref:Lipoprotein n=1 Tax=Corallococcus soli TaxID=2710757 RepID=A0ABR9PWB5_9BACT|nr:hypothetical protein [Corallococcus soli]MBE4752223.1 hypothetical protein [Corallococcus soli]